MADRARRDGELVGGVGDAAEARERVERLQAVQRREALTSSVTGSGSLLPPEDTFQLDDLAGIQDVQRIVGALDARHQFDRVGAMLLDEEVHLVQADAVLAGAGAVDGERARDDALVQALGLLELVRLCRVGEDRAVEVAVADVAEDRRGQGKPPLCP